MKLSILGCGNWGSVFGIIQHRNGHSVRIWEYDRNRADKVSKTRNNAPFLVGYTIPEEITILSDLEQILKGADAIAFALPCQVLQHVIEHMPAIDRGTKYLVSLIKGIDTTTLKRPSEIIRQVRGSGKRVYVLSGPSIANEIIRGEPTAVVLVGPDTPHTQELQHLLATDILRIYQGDDMVGVELCAAIKNVIAIGCGISDGFKFGTNAKGALITRGIVEMQRLGTALGAQQKTFWGLAGLGDLVTTSFSQESRNHRFGEKIGMGMRTEQIAQDMVMVAEGVPTSKAVKRLAEQYRIEMPICDVVYRILFENTSPHTALKELMERPLKNE